MANVINYKKHLNSKKWVEIKNNLKRDRICEACGKVHPRIEAHHRTYENLGNETPKDILFLCQPCHAFIHNIARDLGIGFATGKWEMHGIDIALITDTYVATVHPQQDKRTKHRAIKSLAKWIKLGKKLKTAKKKILKFSDYQTRTVQLRGIKKRAGEIIEFERMTSRQKALAQIKPARKIEQFDVLFEVKNEQKIKNNS